MVEISNGKNCNNCNKSSVCKYYEDAIQAEEKIISDVEKLELPLIVNFNCKEWSSKNTSAIR